jgi:ribosomal protein L29
MAKKEDLKGKSVAELKEALKEAHSSLANLSFDLSSAHRNVKEHRGLRKTIARLNTELRTRELQN